MKRSRALLRSSTALTLRCGARLRETGARVTSTTLTRETRRSQRQLYEAAVHRFNELWRVAFGTLPPSAAIANVTCEGAIGQQCLRTRDHRSVGVNQIVDSHLHGEKVCWQGCGIVPAARI